MNREHAPLGSRELNLKSFVEVELSDCHHCNGLRPGSIRRARALTWQVADAAGG